jgi:hypothetical protein
VAEELVRERDDEVQGVDGVDLTEERGSDGETLSDTCKVIRERGKDRNFSIARGKARGRARGPDLVVEMLDT